MLNRGCDNPFFINVKRREKYSMSQVYKASCLCGAVHLTVDGFSAQAAHCHCSMCRKFHGAAFGTLVGVTGIKWLTGLDSLQEFTASNGTIRTFCHVCGSSIGFRGKGAPFTDVELAISLFDEEIPVQIDANIYTDSQANWCELNDKLTCFTKGRV